MTTTESPSVDNGVNVAALLGAREALTAAPEAAAVPVAGPLRRGCDGTHTRTTVEDFSGLGAEQSHRTRLHRSTPTTRRSSRPRITA